MMPDSHHSAGGDNCESEMRDQDQHQHKHRHRHQQQHQHAPQEKDEHGVHDREPHPHHSYKYKYNDYPGRSSSSSSSYCSTNNNLSSCSSASASAFQPLSQRSSRSSGRGININNINNKSSSPPTTASTSTASMASSSTVSVDQPLPLPLPSSPLSKKEEEVGASQYEYDGYSIREALSLYEAFASISESLPSNANDNDNAPLGIAHGTGTSFNSYDNDNNNYQDNPQHNGAYDDRCAANMSLDETLSSNYNYDSGDFNENQSEGDCSASSKSNNNAGACCMGESNIVEGGNIARDSSDDNAGSIFSNNKMRCIGANYDDDDDAKSINESNSDVKGRSLKENDGKVNDENLNEDDDDESTTSWRSFSSSNTLMSSMNFINRHRKKAGTLLLSMASLWVYSKYNQAKQQQRRHPLRNGRYMKHNIRKEERILGVYRWLLQLLSQLGISKYLQQTMVVARLTSLNTMQSLSNAVKSSSQSTKSQQQPWNDAAATPLSHLLAMAKSGNVSKVMLRGSALSYLHSMKPSPTSFGSSSSSQTQQSQKMKRQRWSKTTLPSQNPNVLNEIISTLLKNGCDDITNLPESLWRRLLNGPAVMVLPFAYLAALYWMMRRLQRQQFEDGDREDGGVGGDSLRKGRGSSQYHGTTFDDVAGIDSSLQELSEILNYVRNPALFHSVGAQPPRGVLLHGPPGSGKTLLARAIAGEAERNVDGTNQIIGGNAIDYFAVCSGSEFVETYVGRGAARVRSLFRNVREEALRNFHLRQKRQLKRWNTVSKTNDGGSIEDRGMMTRAMSGLSDRMMDVWEGMQTIVTAPGRDDPIAQAENNYQMPMAIIFIDEIDALAKRRDSGIGLPSSLGGGGCDEREQTLNQLLTEMDGFATGGGGSSLFGVNVIVIAATNRPEVLDPAIMRPGRFDRHVRVALPDARGREAILRVHARRIRWDHSCVKFGELPTHNFSGADLKNVINEAALLAVRNGASMVTQDHLLEAVKKVGTMMNRYGSVPMHQAFMRKM